LLEKHGIAFDERHEWGATPSESHALSGRLGDPASSLACQQSL